MKCCASKKYSGCVAYYFAKTIYNNYNIYLVLVLVVVEEVKKNLKKKFFVVIGALGFRSKLREGRIFFSLGEGLK